MMIWFSVLHPLVISRQWKADKERLWAMKHRTVMRWIPPPAGFKPMTLWTEVGKANYSATGNFWDASAKIQWGIVPDKRDFVCVEALRPSESNGVMLSAVSLPNHTSTGQA